MTDAGFEGVGSPKNLVPSSIFGSGGAAVGSGRARPGRAGWAGRAANVCRTNKRRFAAKIIFVCFNSFFYRKIKEHPKTVVKRARRAQTRFIRTRRGEIDPCASFWHMLKKSIIPPAQSKNRQKQLLNERAKPKLASYEPEGGKPTLAHLSGTCLQNA